MNTELKKYQEKALAELLVNSNLCLDREGLGEVIIFQSPTGSGKTIVMAKYIEQLIKERPKDDLCFVWLSVGKGDLHIQSKKALEGFFDGFPVVKMVDEEIPGVKNSIRRNEVLVANWQKLYNKDKETGEWINIIMKDGEKINFREVLRSTQEKGRKIILIIDESQYGHKAERTTEIKELIGPEFIVEVSATPVLQRESTEVILPVYVNPEDVIKEGMIKKELIINAGLEDVVEKMQDEDGSRKLILETAYVKRNEIKENFAKLGIDINPLTLIQIPNADDGERKYEATIKFLKEKGETIDNGKVGVWLSDKKTNNLVGITDSNDDTNFLIFKQAIDTGWDCPRAHILVKLREPGNEIFEIQTVGRILRTPERKHYGDSILDTGYIYSNSTKISVKPDEYKMNIIKRLNAKRKDTYKSIHLPSFYKSRLDYGDITANFQEVFITECNKYFGIQNTNASENKKKLKIKGVEIDSERYKASLLANTTISTKDFDTLEGELPADSRVKIFLAVDEMEEKFYIFLSENLGSFTNKKRSAPIMATAFYVWFKKYIDFKIPGNDVILLQSAVVDPQNIEHFRNILNNAVKTYEEIKKQDQIEKEKELENYYTFEVPGIEYYNENTQERVDRVPRYIMTPCYLGKNRSNPEKHFENFLEENGENISWWWKNGENKKEYFGIKYEYVGEVRTFYPDYIVQFKDGRIGVFETKHESDQDGATKTRAKAEKLQEYIKEQKEKNLFGGIVIEKSDGWKINQKEKYDWSKCEKNDWSDWEKLEF